MEITMILNKITIACAFLFFLRLGVTAERTFENGWTIIMHEDYVDYCVGSAVNKNIQYLVDKKVIHQGSDRYRRFVKKIKQHQTSVCECTHDRIMEIYRYNEITQMMRERARTINIAKNCNDQVLSRKKHPKGPGKLTVNSH